MGWVVPQINKNKTGKKDCCSGVWTSWFSKCSTIARAGHMVNFSKKMIELVGY